MKKSIETPIQQQELFQLAVPAIKIKNIEAVVLDVTIEIIPNKVLIQGIIHKQIFFVGEDNFVHHEEENLPFSTFIEVPGAQPGMDAIVDITIEHIKAILTPQGDAISQEVLIRIEIEVVEWIQTELLPLDEGQLYKLKQVIGDEVEQTMVEKVLEMEIPAVKITEIQAEVINITESIIQDKVIIQGEIHEQVFFVDEEGMGRHQAADIPFSLFIDISGVLPGMDLQVSVNIEHIKANLADEGQLLEQEIILEFFVKVTEMVQLPIAPGTGPLLNLEQVVNEGEDQLMETNSIQLPFPAVKVREIQAEVQDVTTVILANKLVIQGVIHKQLFYIDEDDIERHQAEDVSFSHFLDLPGISPGMIVQLTPTIEHVVADLLPDNVVHQKMVVSLFAKITETVRIQVAEGPGPLFKVQQLIGEGVRQELILPPPIIPPPPPPPLAIVTITVKEIRVIEVIQQEILEEIVPIDFPVIKVKNVTADVQNVVVEIINQKAIVSGIVQKQIQLVDDEGIVRHLKEEIPFQFLKELPEDVDPDLLDVNPQVSIEHLEANLINNCQELHQVIILLIQLSFVESRLVTVVTDVEGPGITTVKQPVLANEVVSIVEREIVVTEDVELDPPATEIIDAQAQLLAIKVEEIMEGEFLVSGVIEKEVEYAVNAEIETLVEVFDFTQLIPLEAAQPDRLIQIEEAQVVDLDWELSPQGELLTQEVTIGMEIVVTEEEETQVVIDVTGVTDFETDLVQFIEPPEPKEVVTDVTF